MKRDLEKYLVSVQKQYTEMTKVLDEANELASKGELPTDKVKSIQDQINIIYTNYQRVLYCRYLYMLPPKFIQKIQQKKINKQMEKWKKDHADQETVVNENDDCLNKMKEEINNG